VVEAHVVEVDVLAVHGHRLPGEQSPHHCGDLFQRRQLRGREGTDLAHPIRHTVADAADQPAGVDPGQRGQLHRGQRRVAEHGREDADTDREVIGGAERDGGRGHPAAQEAVLDNPQLLIAERLDFPRVPAELLGRARRTEHGTDPELAHPPILHPPILPSGGRRRVRPRAARSDS
jgi:hypothetical protein